MHLDHTIVPAKDPEKLGQFYSDFLGMEYKGIYSHFIAIKVNENLTLLLDKIKEFPSYHYAFQASLGEYEAILNRLKNKKIPFGNGPSSYQNLQEYGGKDEKGFYFKDLEGHILEVISRNDS